MFDRGPSARPEVQVRQSSTGFTAYVTHPGGTATDVAVPADYDGDGKVDPAVFHPSTGQWSILKSSTNFTTFLTMMWGAAADTAVPGDYDGDGKADVAVFRPSTGVWFIRTSSSNYDRCHVLVGHERRRSLLHRP